MRVRRWLIRGFFLGLLVLCAGGWAASGKWWTNAGYSGNQSIWEIKVTKGKAWIFVFPNHVRGHYDVGWFVNWFPITESDQFNEDGLEDECQHFLGFSVMQRWSYPFEIWCGVPFWFLSCVLALASWWAWRKTRPLLIPKTAFPVEVVKSKE